VVVRLQAHAFKKDPGDVTGAFLPLAEGDVVIIDSITICGLGYVDPSKFERAVVVSKFVPRVTKAVPVARRLYGDDRFREVAEEYLRRVKCFKRGPHKLCVAPYGMDYQEALKIIEERSVRRGLPEEVILAHELASAAGLWLTRAPSPLGS